MKLHDEHEIKIEGTCRPMVKKDIPAVYNLYIQQNEKYSVKFKYSQQELGHLLMPIQDVVQTIVIEDSETNKVTDFISFYNLPSQILKQEGHNYTDMKVAYLYYYGLSVNDLTEVMKYALHYAKK